MKILKPDYEHYKGVRPLNIYVLRIYFALMFFMMGQTAWTEILTHSSEWKPIDAVTWCVWASYATLSIIGIYNTLKMLPIVIFMVFYKTLWLIVVAYPLWSSNTLTGSSAEELATIFMGALVALPFIPWKYFFKIYILPTKR